MAELFDFSFSFHSLAAVLKRFNVNQFFGFMHPSVSCPSSLFVHFKSFFNVFCVSSVVAAVFALEYVNVVVGQTSSLKGQLKPFRSCLKKLHLTRLVVRAVSAVLLDSATRHSLYRLCTVHGKSFNRNTTILTSDASNRKTTILAT